MKRQLLSVFLFATIFSFAFKSFGQNFSIVPNDTAIATIGCNADHELDISFPNLTASDLNLTWQVNKNSLPSCWDVVLCDYGICFNEIPMTHVMNPIPAGESGFLKLTAYVTDHGGAGKVSFKVYETGSTMTYDVVFIVDGCTSGLSCTNVGISEVATPGFNIFPNPVEDHLQISASGQGIGHIEVFDMIGNKLIAADANSNRYTLPVKEMTKGLYLVKVTQNGTTYVKRMIKN